MAWLHSVYQPLINGSGVFEVASPTFRLLLLPIPFSRSEEKQELFVWRSGASCQILVIARTVSSLNRQSTNLRILTFNSNLSRSCLLVVDRLSCWNYHSVRHCNLSVFCLQKTCLLTVNGIIITLCQDWSRPSLTFKGFYQNQRLQGICLEKMWETCYHYNVVRCFDRRPTHSLSNYGNAFIIQFLVSDQWNYAASSSCRESQNFESMMLSRTQGTTAAIMWHASGR